jgi:hypothetical protein
VAVKIFKVTRQGGPWHSEFLENEGRNENAEARFLNNYYFLSDPLVKINRHKVKEITQ